MKQKRLVILGASIFQVPFIKKAVELGVYVGIIDINDKAPGIEYANEYFKCSLLNKKEVLRIVEDFDADGITVGTCESAVVTAAYVASVLELPFYSQEVAEKATNKISMIKAFKECGVSCPEYEVIREGERIDTQIEYPVITKPADKSASKGIYYAENASQLKYAVKKSMEFSDSKEVIIQEYMDGPEFSVELAVIEQNPVVLQITDKITTGAPHYIEIGQVQPSAIDKKNWDRISQLACLAATAVGLENCVGHAEIKLTSKGPKMVEIGGRMGGHFIDSYLLEGSSGYKIQDAVLKYALGNGFCVDKGKIKGAMAVKCILSSEGVIGKISGVSAAKQVAGVEDVILNCEEGECYSIATSNNDLIAFVIATGKNSEQALEICDQAIAKIDIQYK